MNNLPLTVLRDFGSKGCTDKLRVFKFENDWVLVWVLRNPLNAVLNRNP